MRTLFITPMLPVSHVNEMGGKHRRASSFLRALHGMGSTIDMMQIVPERMIDTGTDADALNASQSRFWGVPLRVALAPRRVRRQTLWSHYGAGILSHGAQPKLFPYGGRDVGRHVAGMLDELRPDIVLLDRLDAAVALMASGRRPANVLFDMDDIYHKVQWRAATSSRPGPAQAADIAQLPALGWAERRACRLSARTFVCSKADQQHLQRLRFPPGIVSIPNAVRVPDQPPGLVAERTVLYLGSFHHRPNILAAERLITRVFPAIRARLPDARLLIAGFDSEKLPSAGKHLPGIDILGFADDLGALYALSRIVCCPITTGSGTRLKLVEAAAYARPMVSTVIGAEGLAFEDGQDILLRDDDAGLAAASVELLTNDASAVRLGEAARRRMQSVYDTEAVEHTIAEIVRDVLEGRDAG